MESAIVWKNKVDGDKNLDAFTRKQFISLESLVTTAYLICRVLRFLF